MDHGPSSTFTLTATVPSGQLAVSNMPATETVELGNGAKRITFGRSPKMSTYLLFFSAGDFDRLTTTAEGVEIGVIAQAGKAEQARFALESSAEVLREYNDYFGTPYPLPKLDNVAAPGGSQFFSAMENWGAILTFEHTLLLDPSIASVGDRQRVFSVAAHEIAHQWFGNLVTPDWWTDIWLNEAFASWMANKIAHAYWPEGELDRDTLSDALGAMAVDSLASTRRIREPVLRNEEIEDSFDSISYQKGGGVLAMFENYVGEEAFRAGVRLHMERFAHSVADADQFVESLAQGSGQRGIVESFRSFIDQPGVPVVEARLQCAADTAPRIELRQRRYAPLGSTIDADGQQWQIPVCIAYDTVDAPGRVCTLLTERAATLALVPGAANDSGLDHFVERDGLRFAGTHLIIDLWQASRLDDLAHVEQALREATIRAGATLLNIDLHHFTPNGGISGVAVLAESHISIHTWPERAYAARTCVLRELLSHRDLTHRGRQARGLRRAKSPDRPCARRVGD